MVIPLSIALIGGVLLFLSYFWAYTYERTVVMVAILNGLLAVTGYARCRAIGPAGSPSVDWLSQWKNRIHNYRPSGGHALLAFACLVFLGSVAYAILSPKQKPTLTEFYVLTQDGHLPLSPEQIANSSTVTYGIHNLEGRPVEYQILALAETSNGSTELWSQLVTVPVGATLERAIDLSSKPPDTQAIRLLLFLPNIPEPYRSLHLVLNQDTSS
jgi:uncharacterized membrane protein